MLLVAPQAQAATRQVGIDIPVQWYADASGQMTIDRFAALPTDQLATTRQIPSFGYSRKIWWLRSELDVAAMDEAGVPFTGRILYVTPTVMNLLKKADYAYRTITSEDGSVSRMVSSLDGVQIVMVPAALMKTAYTFTEGYAAKSDALQINMLLLHPDAVVAPISYQFAQLDPPAAFSEGKYIYFEESCEDVFLLSSKVNGVQFNITPAATTNS